MLHISYLRFSFAAASLAAASLILVACDDGGASPATDGDAETADTTETDEITDTADGDEVENPDAVDEVVESEVEASEEVAVNPDEQDVSLTLITDPTWSFGGPAGDGGAGDYLIQNQKARFVVQSGGLAKTWIRQASGIIDADIRRHGVASGAGKDQDLLVEVSPMTDFIRSFKVLDTQVVSDGSDGVAILKSIGQDGGVPIIDSVIAFGMTGLQAEVTYELDAEHPVLTVTTTVKNTSGLGTMRLGDGIWYLRRCRDLTPGYGLTTASLPTLGSISWLVGVGDSVSYGYLPDGENVRVAIDQANIYPIFNEGQETMEGSVLSYKRRFIVGETADDVLKEIYRLTGVAAGALTVTVTTEDANENPADWEVQVIDDIGAIINLRPGESDGELSFTVPAGVYTIKVGNAVRGYADSAASATVVADGTASLAITLPSPARLSVVASGDGRTGALDRLPAKVLLQAGADADVNAGVVARYWTLGEDTFIVPPGDYTVTISHGYQHTLCRRNVTLTTGTTSSVACTLTDVVDNDGWIAADLHIHCELSVDAVSKQTDRVRQLLSEGIDLVSYTDHDRINKTIQGIAEATPMPVNGKTAADYITFLRGDEVSPPWAHFNAHVLPSDLAIPTYYGIEWWDPYTEGSPDMTTQPKLCKAMKETYRAGLVQMNHPGHNNYYWENIRYSPDKDISLIPQDVFDPTYVDMTELINNNDTGITTKSELPIWYNQLNAGYRFTGVGVSDSHRDNDPGHARTYLYIGDAQVNASTGGDILITAVKAHRAIAATGPFVTMTIEDAMIGDEMTPASADIPVHIKVQAPAWVPLTMVKVIANGAEVASVDPTEFQAADGVRYEGTINITIDKDTWFVVIAGAPELGMGPQQPGLSALSITNPIWVDLDGDGFDKPGFVASQR